MAQVAGAALLHPERGGPPKGFVQCPQRRRHPRAALAHLHGSLVAASAAQTGSDIPPRPPAARRKPPCCAWLSRAAILVAGGLAGQGGHLGGTTMVGVAGSGRRHDGCVRSGPWCPPEGCRSGVPSSPTLRNPDLKPSGTEWEQKPEAVPGSERPGQKQAVGMA